MAESHAFYRKQAADAQAGASAATLKNVRDRWLLSEKTWTALAEQGERSEAARDKLILQKVRERAVMIAAA